MHNRIKKCNTCSPDGVIRAWHTPQRHKSAGEYRCVREQHIEELCRSDSPKHYLWSWGVTICPCVRTYVTPQLPKHLPSPKQVGSYGRKPYFISGVIRLILPLGSEGVPYHSPTVLHFFVFILPIRQEHMSAKGTRERVTPFY